MGIGMLRRHYKDADDAPTPALDALIAEVEAPVEDELEPIQVEPGDALVDLTDGEPGEGEQDENPEDVKEPEGTPDKASPEAEEPKVEEPKGRGRRRGRKE